MSVGIAPGTAGFIEHIAIVDGGLQVDPRAPASGLLYEAGHISTVAGAVASFATEVVEISETAPVFQRPDPKMVPISALGKGTVG